AFHSRANVPRPPHLDGAHRRIIGCNGGALFGYPGRVSMFMRLFAALWGEWGPGAQSAAPGSRVSAAAAQGHPRLSAANQTAMSRGEGIRAVAVASARTKFRLT